MEYREDIKKNIYISLENKRNLIDINKLCQIDIKTLRLKRKSEGINL